MEPINGWNEIEEAGSFEQIELGGHICVIKGARCEKTKSGNDMIVVAFDFAPEDKQAGYFKNLFEMDKKRDPESKWKGTYYQGLRTEQSTPFFKAFINRIIESNNGYQWSWDESTLVEKKFCGVFGREQYQNSKGDLKFSTKCMQVRAITDLDIVTPPADKLINGTTSRQNDLPSAQNHYSTGALDISSDDLPF
ncbi:hypothetical protein ACWG0P_08950 [Amedibacillus sp. YH-ame6]